MRPSGIVHHPAHDPDALILTLERAPALMIPLIREVPPARLKQRPQPGKWSAYEHACHLATDHALFLERLDRMLAQDDPVIEAVEPGADEGEKLMRMDLDAVLLQFVRERGQLVERLRALTPAQWARTGRHTAYAPYTVFIMFRHLAMHGMLHAYRIEELALKRDW
jgi:hypothetical protein